jgi:hypothetical protein
MATVALKGLGLGVYFDVDVVGIRLNYQEISFIM